MPVFDRRGKPLPKDHPFKWVRIIFTVIRPMVPKNAIEPEEEPLDELTLEIVEAAMNSRRPMNEVLNDGFLRNIVENLDPSPLSVNKEDGD